MAAVSGGGKVQEKLSQLNSTSNVHVFDFKYKSDESFENIQSYLSNKIIKQLATTRDLQSANDNDFHFSSNISSCHRILEIGNNVESVVINKAFVCALENDGVCYRAPFILRSSQSKSDNKASKINNDSHINPLTNSKETRNFQIDSDESYARTVQRNFTNSPVTLQTPHPHVPQMYQDISLFNSNIQPSSISQLSRGNNNPPSLYLSITPRLHLSQRLSQNLHVPRYMPYHRHRNRQSHPLRQSLRRIIDLPSNPRIFYGTDEGDNPDTASLRFLSGTDNIQEIPVEVIDDQYPFEVASNENSIDSSHEQFDLFNAIPPVEYDFVNAQMSDSNQSTSNNTEESINETEFTTIPTEQQFPLNNFMAAKQSPSLSEVSSGEDFHEIGEMKRGILEESTKFHSIYSMKSGFLLLDVTGVLWMWCNNKNEPMKMDYNWNGQSDVNVAFVGCSNYRATVALSSKMFVTFHDCSFKDVNNDVWPTVINHLSHDAILFDELVNESVADIQCSNFYTVVHTVSGKVFWWGLAPASERHSQKTAVSKQNKPASGVLQVGDTVSLAKQDKHETGVLIFNHRLWKFGVITLLHSNKTEPPIDSQSKRFVHVLNVDEQVSSEGKSKTEVWDTKHFIFLEEENEFTGEIISFDGPYAIVQHNNPSSTEEKLKVYFKTSLEKIDKTSAIGQSRYEKYLFKNPVRVFCDERNKVAAVSCSEAGISVLFNRAKDNHAFLTYPNRENSHSTWFTCGKDEMVDSKKNNCRLFTTTVEYESVPAYESNLCLIDVDGTATKKKVINCTKNTFNMKTDRFKSALSKAQTLTELETMIEKTELAPKFSRSVSSPVPCNPLKRKRKSTCPNRLCSIEFRKPKLYSVLGGCSGTVNFLLDNKNCFYPVRFDCCLREPPLFHLPPIDSFAMFEQSTMIKDQNLLTIVAVVRRSPFIEAIKTGRSKNVEKVLGKKPTNGKKMKVEEENSTEEFTENPNALWDVLSEHCSGNQNVLHVAASNILKVKKPSPATGNIMDVRSDQEDMALQELLENPLIWCKVRELLCERDSHGCTPFLQAVMTQNLYGAFLILNAVKEEKNKGKNATPLDPVLFKKAICAPTFSGLTPLHCLIHSSSKKAFSHQWYNTLKISNLPQNYSSRLLLKLFKSHYPSAYRAFMPIPKPHWTQLCVRGKLKENKERAASEEENPSNKKISGNPPSTSSVRPPVYRASMTPGLSYSTERYHPNQADLIRANAKEGLVMFGNINEMFQALIEMNNYALLSRTAHPSGALLSVVQHMLQVQQYQESLTEHDDKNNVSNTRPLLELRRRLSAMPHPNSNIGPPRTPNSMEISNSHREETISKCFDDIMGHLLISALLEAEPNIALTVNSEGESALSYFIKTYPRYSPSNLHKVFLNWRPCNTTNCKYNRHVGGMTITPQSYVDSHSNVEKKPTASKEETKKLTLLNPDEQPLPTSSNPILARRGLQSRSRSLMINVDDQFSSCNDMLGSPATPSIKLLQNLKYGPIEVQANTGLTPQVPSTAGTSRKGTIHNPFFPPIPPAGSMAAKQPASDSKNPENAFCTCHLNKARLLWNTTFEASHFLLAKDWSCLVSTILCTLHDGKLELVPCNKLDAFTSNILLNPYSVLLEIAIKTIMGEFMQNPISQNASLLSSLQSMNPTDSFLLTGTLSTSLVPWLTIQRFVRSLVRQLALFLSKNTMSESNLKYKIGRYLKKNHSKKETKMKENLTLCLRAFSWISVLEILRAAVVMLKPIRNGTVKAQAKGVIHGAHLGQSSGRNSSTPNLRMQASSSMTSINRPMVIRNATRQTLIDSPACATSLLPNDTNVPPEEEITSSDSDDNYNNDDPFPPLTDEGDPNEVDWMQSQGITPALSIAWAVDGHIRMRNEASTRGLPPPGLWHFGHQNHLAQQIMNTPSIHAGYLYLARMFCRLVKEACDIAVALQTDCAPETGSFLLLPLPFPDDVKDRLMVDAQELLSSSWQWMEKILTSLETQLTTGEQFDTKHYVLRLKKSNRDEEMAGIGRPPMMHMYGSTPDEYMMHLLKEDMAESKDSLPVLDLFSYTHITYVLDAYLYTKKFKPFSKHAESSNKDVTTPQTSTIDTKFFGAALDLLTKGKLDEYWKFVEAQKYAANNISMWLDKSLVKNSSSISANSSPVGPPQWKRVVDSFTTLFLTEGPGYERDSFLAVKAGSSGRVSRFQRLLAAVRGSGGSRMYSSSSQENPSLLMNVVRTRLLEDCIDIFTQNMDTHPFGTLRVRFEGEEGTGPGVSRGLFPAFANAIKSGQKYKDWPIELFKECGNLPSQRGVFSPTVGQHICVETPMYYFSEAMTQEKRYTVYMAIGRFLGLTMWFNQTIPFILSRPVLMYLLDREDEITFSDLAFYDSLLFESFAHMMSDALSSKCTEQEFADCYCSTFQIVIDDHAEGLLPDGKNVSVTKENCLNYMRLYTKHLLVTSRENELLGLRDGLQQMVPKDLLDTLEPEDLQLVISGGIEDVPYNRLRSIVTFSNSRACTKEVFERYKRWFWKIVYKMAPLERQKLLYFATGSSVLPALDNRVGNNEELAITIDIIDTVNSSALPMSSTCGQRISTPLYPSKLVLKQKLLQAIECQSYGLG